MGLVRVQNKNLLASTVSGLEALEERTGQTQEMSDCGGHPCYFGLALHICGLRGKLQGNERRKRWLDEVFFHGMLC